jgi:hypothetical protein
MNRINEIISDGCDVLIEVFSQYDPDRLIDSIVINDANKAMDLVLYYANDYTYIRYAN